MVAVLGPTASGKSALALELAERFQGEIVCADSTTVYRGLDLGTAKPTPDERARVPHHLLDLLEPDQPFSLAEFQLLARQAIDSIPGLPLLVGGSGLYVRGLLQGYTLPEVPPDEAFRAGAAGRPLSDLVAELGQIDPEALQLVDLANPRRVVRALEVCRAGKLFSAHYKRSPPPWRVLKLALEVDGTTLRQRIEQRARKMLADGLLEEVFGLTKKGYAPHLRKLRIIGYEESLDVLEGRRTPEEGLEALVLSTWQLSRRQLTWLRSEPDLTRVATAAEAYRAVEEFLHDPRAREKK